MNFYKEAAKMLDLIESKRSSVKGCLSMATPKDRKRLGALIIETLKMKPTIMAIIDATPIMREERRHLYSPTFAAVLVHDLLFNPGGIQSGDGCIKQAINRHKTRLQAELVKLKVRRGAQSNADLARAEDPRVANIPRYLRVNRNLWTTEDAIQFYVSMGYTQAAGSKMPLLKQFRCDEHIPDLFVFNSEYMIHTDEAYKSGKMIAQDKASCFPALVLSPPALGGTVIDATAAPGNKTSHISALMGNYGKASDSLSESYAAYYSCIWKILAFERNKRRFKTLQEMLRRADCHNVETILGDFLEQDPADERFKDVTHILLDPSCSGSGIVNRLDYLTQEDLVESDQELSSRLAILSAFQKRMICHAAKFPSVIRIVYSTCSVHAEENEAVVRDVLTSSDLVIRGFKLAPRSLVLPRWKRRGIDLEGLDTDCVDALVRCSPEDEPGTNGFFVACFIRESVSRKAVGAVAPERHKRRVAFESGASKKRRVY